MSQKKVDAYKANKKNRGEISKKQNKQRRFEMFAVIILLILGIGYFSFATVYRYNAAKTTKVEIQTEAVDNFITDVQTGAGNSDADSAAETEEAVEEEAEKAE